MTCSCLQLVVGGAKFETQVNCKPNFIGQHPAISFPAEPNKTLFQRNGHQGPLRQSIPP